MSAVFDVDNGPGPCSGALSPIKPHINVGYLLLLETDQTPRTPRESPAAQYMPGQASSNPAPLGGTMSAAAQPQAVQCLAYKAPIGDRIPGS